MFRQILKCEQTPPAHAGPICRAAYQSSQKNGIRMQVAIPKIRFIGMPMRMKSVNR